MTKSRCTSEILKRLQLERLTAVSEAGLTNNLLVVTSDAVWFTYTPRRVWVVKRLYCVESKYPTTVLIKKFVSSARWTPMNYFVNLTQFVHEDSLLTNLTKKRVT